MPRKGRKVNPPAALVDYETASPAVTPQRTKKAKTTTPPAVTPKRTKKAKNVSRQSAPPASAIDSPSQHTRSQECEETCSPEKEVNLYNLL